MQTLELGIFVYSHEGVQIYYGKLYQTTVE